MNKIVKIIEDEPFVGTFSVAKGFNRKHQAVVKIVKKYEQRFLRLGNNKRFLKPLIIETVAASTAGRPVKQYILNEGQCLFLGTLFSNSEIVLDFKERLAVEFIKAKKLIGMIQSQKENEEWKSKRIEGKRLRIEETDEIKKFIEYAKKQGSKSPDKYYLAITKMVNSLLFICEDKFKNLREIMTPRQLFTIGAADGIIEKGLKDGMQSEIYYKEIFQQLKKKVNIFAELYGRTNIPSDLLLESD